jgi:hypothetical protein
MFKKPVPFHPLLFAVFPMLFLYVNNLGEVEFGQVVQFSFFSLLAASALWLILQWWRRDRHVSAIMTSLLLMLFYSYGHFENMVGNFSWRLGGLYLGPTKILLAFWMVLLVSSLIWPSRIKQNQVVWSRFFNGFAVILIVTTLVRLLPLLLEKEQVSSTPQPLAAPALTQATEKPDIYYIIMDEYVRQDVLQTIYGYDNNAFLNALRARKFYVADSSHSNYGVTGLSMVSALNMGYVEDLSHISSGHQIRRLYYEKIPNSTLLQTLRAWGYKIASVSTGIWFTKIPQADYVLASPSGDFQHEIIRTSLVRGLNDVINFVFKRNPFYDEMLTRGQRQKIQHGFEQLSNSIDLPGPKFVLAHFISPHPPFVFGPNGETVLINSKLNIFADGENLINGTDGMTEEEFKKGYRDQVAYVNGQLLKVIDHLLQQPKPPIIIVQGDHGTRLYRSQQYTTATISQEELFERMSILNAYYFPDQKYEALKSSMTPVNSFRIVLNHFFQQNMPLEPDRFYFSTMLDQGRIFDVTSRIRP